MLNKKTTICTLGALFFVLGTGLLLAPPSFGAFIYKNYLVKYDQGWDILCEPYIVQKNDWVLKVFMKKGEIAYDDFKEFLRIFKRINPHIQDANHLRPGQQILIPLKRIELETLPGQETGRVTIPFVTLSDPAEMSEQGVVEYIVRKGDTVSVLISQSFGHFGTAGYQRGIDAFRRLNPHVTDINWIYSGQKIFLPHPKAGALADRRQISVKAAPHGLKKVPSPDSLTQSAIGEPLEGQPISALKQAASVMEARLLDKGTYYFPRRSAVDASLDLSRYPVMEFKNGTRILFMEKGEQHSPEVAIAKSFWKDLYLVDLAPNEAVDDIMTAVMEKLQLTGKNQAVSFSDRDIRVTVRSRWMVKGPFLGDDQDRRICINLIQSPEQRTPDAITRYLDKHQIILREILPKKKRLNRKAAAKAYPIVNNRAFILEPNDSRALITALIKAMGYPFSPNVKISFPYAGVQVEAVSNLISKPDGTPVFLDFGDLYGEAIEAIRKTGFEIVQVMLDEPPFAVLTQILNVLDLAITRNPTLMAAERPDKYNTALRLPGLMVGDGDQGQMRWLVTQTQLPTEVVHFLNNKKVTVLRIDDI